MKTTFNIDLLKGNGIPSKSGLSGIALAFITIAVPVFIGITVTELYAHNKVVTNVKKNEINSLEKKIDELSGALEQQKAMEQEKMHYNLCLSEVYTTITKYSQWSPVLSLLVENLPDSVMLTELAVEQDSVKKKIPNVDNPGIMIEVDDVVTTMKITVCDSSQSDNDKVVQQFRDYLCSSSVLGPMLDKTDVSKETGTLAGKDVVYYMIDCVLKSGL